MGYLIEEDGMRTVCKKMCSQLHNKYPLVIKSPQYYFDVNNDKKYDMD